MSGTSVDVIPAVRLNRTIAVPRERVFKAWTDVDELKNWFFPADGYTIPFAEINLRTNTRYRIAMKNPNGTTQLFGGVIQQLIVPERLHLTWAQNGGGTQQKKMFISIEFMEKGDQTEIHFIHENFPDDQIRESYEKSWNFMFNQLEQYVH